MFNPKEGDKVAVCYDGKMSRMVEGLVVDVWEETIKVKFIPRYSNKKEEVIVEFDKTGHFSYGGYLVFDTLDISLESLLVRTEGDWYNIYRMREYEQYRKW